MLKIGDTIRIGDWLLLIETFAKTTSLEVPNWTQEDLTVRCIQIIEETHNVKTFYFVAEPRVNFFYQPGQFVTLNLNIDGENIQRSYSISSSPSRSHKLTITVKRIPSGLVSNWLHDHLKVGDLIKISPPMGNFTCYNEPNPKLLMISAGSGITPMMSMTRWLHDIASDVDIIFFYSAQTPDDLIFQKELELLAEQNPNFHLKLTLTQSESNIGWSGLKGRLNAKILKSFAPDFLERTVYVCGPDGFMKTVKTLLVDDLDFPMEHYFQESFGSGKIVKSASVINKVSTLVEPSIIFAKSNKEIKSCEEISILDHAQQQDITIRSGCRQGVCGACKVLKIEGDVTYCTSPDALNESHKKAGYILSCIAYPTGERVVIDA